MNLNHIQTVAKYESKIFAKLALLDYGRFVACRDIGRFTDLFFTYGSLERTALASHVPWLGNYLYAIIQAVIVIFLSGNFLQSDRKLDTTGVIWVRPVTNSAYIAGKVWGTMKVFFVLNIVTLLLVAYLHIAVVRSPFMLYPYVLYLFVISLPSLIFMLGLPCFVMSFVRSRALGYILLLGLTALLFYYAKDLGYGVLDLFASVIPATLSDITGHADLPLFLLQRLTFCLAGIGFSIHTGKRLPA